MTLHPLYPFQLDGAAWLATKAHAFLADEMGLGKSAQAIRACDILGLDNILVICPANCRPNWVREFHRFSPMDRPIRILLNGQEDLPWRGVVICSYDLLTVPKVAAACDAAKKAPGDTKKAARAENAKALRKVREVVNARIKDQQWDAIIIDEAHLLKERTAERTRRIYGRGRKDLGIIQAAKRVWRLSGTPAPNNVSELWTHLYFGDQEVRNFWDFVFQFCAGFDSDYGFKITSHKNEEELKQKIKPFLLRRTTAEVMQQLPPVRYQEVLVHASEVKPADFLDQRDGRTVAQARKDISASEKKLEQVLASMKGNFAVLGAMQQSMATLRRYTVMQKLPAILDILEDELARDPELKLVVFGVHRAAIEGAEARLRGFGAVTLYGSTPSKNRQINIDKFVNDPKCRVFIGNIEAAGTGVDGLQKASCQVCFLEQTWVPASVAQAIARVSRNLQTRPVRVRFFTLPNSVDQKVQAALLNKVRELAKIFS